MNRILRSILSNHGESQDRADYLNELEAMHYDSDIPPTPFLPLDQTPPASPAGASAPSPAATLDPRSTDTGRQVRPGEADAVLSEYAVRMLACECCTDNE